MNKSKYLLFISVLLTGCAKTNPQTIKTVCPSGAPALAFYDQGNNADFVTNSTPTNVLAELQKNEFDFVVFDSINGLKSIKKNSSNFALAKIITGGNFYLVSINKTPDISGNYPLPTNNDIVVSFGQNLIPDIVYSRLCTDFWHIDNNAKYVSSVQDALAVLVSGKYSGGAVDYVFIAEPALTNALNKKDAATFGKVNIVKNIKEEWKKYSGQDGLAQAGIFVNKESLETKKNELSAYMRDIEKRIKLAIENPEEVKKTMDSLYSIEQQTSKFGFNSNLVNKVQEEGRNGFGLVSANENIDVNAFLTKLGQATFEDKYFVTL